MLIVQFNLIKQKQKYWIGQYAFLAFGTTDQILSTPSVDSTMLLSTKVNCRPWVTVHFTLGKVPLFFN